MAIYRGPGGAGDATGDATNASALALAAKDAAQASATSAASSATAAANSATAADTSADSASTSATNAAGSATTASTAATNASSSASDASDSADAAASSASDASDSATAAADSATSASTSASAASTSATNAASSASSASTSASTATTKASEASTSATNAASSATTASTAATNASNSASAASTSETNAASSASSASTSASNASTSASTATTQATNAASSASAAATSETNAASSASAASTSASNASTSATNAASSASSAASSAASAAAALDSFDDRYLGSKTSDPTLDNDGNALATGALYYNSTDGEMRVYDGSQWIAASAAGTTAMNVYKYVATAGQTTFSGAAAVGGTMSYTSGNIIVFLNGAALDSTDYTATNGTSVVLAVAARVSDEVVVVAFKSFTVSDTYTQSAADALLATKVSLTGNQTVAGVKTFSSQPVFSAGIDLSSNGQVKFPATQNASADANTLDDYEEGTWTPQWEGGGSNPTATYSQRSGSYIKIGRMVSCRFQIYTASFSGGSGGLHLGGLPFAIDSATGWSGAVGWNSQSFSNNQHMVNIQGVSNATKCYTHYINSTGASFDIVIGTGTNNTMVVEGSITYMTA